MSPDAAADLSREALLTALLLGAPVLGAAAAIGLLVSLAQAVTQLQDQTLSFVPKIAAMAGVALLALPWMIQLACDYTTDLFENVAPNLGR
ncbi:MAG: flagellar biosynthetic protein FliQ [Planctomycetota bacterium]